MAAGRRVGRAPWLRGQALPAGALGDGRRELPVPSRASRVEEPGRLVDAVVREDGRPIGAELRVVRPMWWGPPVRSRRRGRRLTAPRRGGTSCRRRRATCRTSAGCHPATSHRPHRSRRHRTVDRTPGSCRGRSPRRRRGRCRVLPSQSVYAIFVPSGDRTAASRHHEARSSAARVHRRRPRTAR